METVQESNLLQACEVIFGPGLDLSQGFLDYLQMSGLKTAYRKRARETHPDLNPFPITRAPDTPDFQQVHEAYEQLAKFLNRRGSPIRSRSYPPHYWSAAAHSVGRPAHSAKNTARAEKTSHEHSAGSHQSSWSSRQTGPSASHSAKRRSDPHYYQGHLPRQKLLLGHFIYYSGRVEWRTIVQALSWQMSQRPRIGELASKLGWLKSRDLHRMSRTRRGLERFGECALRLGILNEFQVRVLLAIQRRRQRRIGEYFVENRIFTPQEMEKIVEACRAHNESV